ncbi:MAG: hydrogenase nickel incorporation protein HypB [Bacillota bacterium]|nr:hydrogenase nickel incorporation protein HypB [Bacillota bacterium]
MEIRIMKEIMEGNDKLAGENRKFFEDNNITAVNIMASPGAGKTSLIMNIIGILKDQKKISVIEGDIASSIDAEKIEKEGITALQINTGGGCHLDANVIKLSVEDLALQKDTLLFIENVGNLICPSAFDLGETLKMVIASVPEGHDKPFKYISMFEAADVIVLSKKDLLPYIDFDKEAFYKGIRAVNQKAPVFEISSKTGEGVKELVDWLVEG